MVHYSGLNNNLKVGFDCQALRWRVDFLFFNFFLNLKDIIFSTFFKFGKGVLTLSAVDCV